MIQLVKGTAENELSTSWLSKDIVLHAYYFIYLIVCIVSKTLRYTG